MQLTTIYYSQNRDDSRVELEFSLFNSFFAELQVVCKSVFGESMDKEFFNNMPASHYYFDKDGNDNSN